VPHKERLYALRFELNPRNADVIRTLSDLMIVTHHDV
jgi:hypothetical protein